MPEPKLSPAQFAARIKSQYPEYKDIADDVLAQKVVSKYPEYAESVDFGVKKKEPSDSTTPKVAMESPSEAGSSAPKQPGLLPDFTALRQRQQVEQIGEIPLQKQETYKPTPEQQSKMMRRIADGEVAYVPSPLSQVYEKVKTGVELDPIEQYTYDQRLNKLDVEQKVENYSKVKGLGLAANAGAQLFLDQLYPSAFPGSEELSQYARNMNKAYLISSGVPEEDADKSFSEQKDFINGAKVFGVEAANTVGLSALSAMLMGAPVASFGVTTAAAPSLARQAAQTVSRNIAQNPATFATMGYVGSNTAYKSVKNDPTKSEAEKVAYSTFSGLKEMLTESGFIGDLRAWNQTLSAAEKTAAKATFKSTFMDYQKALRKQGLEEGTEEGASWTGDLLWALGTGEKLPSAREGWEAMALGAVAPGFAVTSQYAPALSDFAAGYLPFTLPKSEDITALSDLKKKKEQVDKDLTTEDLPAAEREKLEAASDRISSNIESLKQKSFEERKNMSPEDFTMLSLIDAKVEGLNNQFEAAKTASMKVEIKQEVIELLAAKKEIEDSYATPKTETDAVQAPSPAEIPNEIMSLNDDETVVFTVESLDKVPKQFRDRAEKKKGAEVEVRETIFGLPIGKKTKTVIGEGYTYLLTGKEAKDYAVQEQTAGEVPVQPGATIGEEVAQGEPQAEPQVAAEEVVIPEEEITADDILSSIKSQEINDRKLDDAIRLTFDSIKTFDGLKFLSERLPNYGKRAKGLEKQEGALLPGRTIKDLSLLSENESNEIDLIDAKINEGLIELSKILNEPRSPETYRDGKRLLNELNNLSGSIDSIVKSVNDRYNKISEDLYKLDVIRYQMSEEDAKEYTALNERLREVNKYREARRLKIDINRLKSWKASAEKFQREGVPYRFTPEELQEAIDISNAKLEALGDVVEIPEGTGPIELRIKDSIKDILSKYKTEEVKASLPEEGVIEKVPSDTQELTEADLPGFDRMMTELDGVVKKSEQRRASREKTFENAMNYVVGSNAYETATDVQRESLVRMVNKRFGKRMKSAPSVGRIFDTIKDIKKITMSEYALLKNQIQSAARGAKDAKVAIANASKSVGASIQDLSNKGRISLKQAASLTNRFAKTNPLDEVSVERFVNYAAKVFSNAEYAAQLAGLAKAIPLAKKNAQKKLGIAEGVAQPIMSMLSISPDLIPDSVMPVYTEILGMLSQRTAVLQLQEIDDVKRKVESVLDAVDLELSKIPELVERFIEYQEKVLDKNEKIDFPKTLSKMVAEGIIDENEAEILRNNRSLVIQRASKEKPTEEELSQEKEALLAMVSVAKVNSARLPSRDERAVAATLSELLSTPAVDMLDNVQLKGLLRAIDNINDGFLPHYAELTVERLNAINESIKINKVLESAKPIKISEAVAKVKAFLFRTKNAPLVEMIRRNPLYYLDQLFGNFKDKTIFNSVFGRVSTAQTKFQTSSNDIRNRLNNAENAVFKSRESDSNEAAKSKYRMMTYLRELEFLSNPGSNQVNPAAAHIQATIDQIETGKSIYTDKEAAMLQEILDKFSEDGAIKMEEIYDSFNNVEKKAIEEIQKINTELRDKAVFTSVIIRGDKISPLNNYMHLNVLHEHRAEEQLIGDAFVNDYNESLRPSTKAKSLIARTGRVSPINFDVFSSTSRGANYVLMDYFLTEPVRTTRKMFAESQKALKSKKAPKQQREILNAVESVFEESIGNLLNRNFTSSSIGDEVGAFISRQGYRSILASVPRFFGELTSNLMFAAIVSPKDFTAGARLKDLVLSADAAKVMDAVGSKQTTRLYPNESLSGRLIDESIMSQAAGAKGSRAKGSVANKINQAYNVLGIKNFQNFVATASDALISTPDKLIMRPLWFGAFANDFKKQTGKDADFDLIASNNEAYMNANKDALARASDYADQTSVFAGASDNAFMGILKGVPNKNQSSFVRYFNTFNNFMTRFLIYEYVTARTGIYAAMGNGAISKKQGVALLAGATTRMVAYSVLVPMLNELMISVFNSLTGRPDEEEEDEKSFAQRLAQGTTSAVTSLLLGRDFGNIIKAPIAYGVERVNQEYLDFLRNGEYDSYKDQIMFTQIPVGEESSRGVSIEDFAINMLGPTAPTVRSLAFAVEKYTAEDKKEAGAIKRQDMEKYVRIPLELAGQAGFIPLYKDIRKILLNEMYKDLRKAEDTPDGLNKMNKKDMELLYPELYNQLYGPDSPLLDYEQIKKDLRKEQKILLESAKYDGAK